MEPRASARPRTVRPYAVRCVEVDAAAEAEGHHHVRAIETADPDGGQTRWTLVQVIGAYREGERFIVGSGEGGQAVELGPSVCPRCRMATLVPEPASSGLELVRCP